MIIKIAKHLDPLPQPEASKATESHNNGDIKNNRVAKHTAIE